MSCGAKGDVLIVDDEPNAIKVLSSILTDEGYEVLEARDAETAVTTIDRENVDAVITDLKMPGKDGMQFFDYVIENHSDIPVIFLTAYGTVESAVFAMTRGVYYYFIKPPDYRKLKSILARAVEQRKLKRELELLKKRLSEENGKHLIVGKTAKTLSILNAIQAVKDSPSSVLISGETGTGKELVARALHYSSARREKPFVAVNCAAIPKELLEAELFGYERGAFTGAISRRVGKFEEAADGTVFLDEIGELELPMQAKLLRVLQEREIERLGSSRKIKADFRLISSTNRDLKREVRAKNFRQDLFYRINVVEIQVPPLREKKDDIPLLCAEFIKEFSIRENKIFTLSDETMQIFRDYDWPGNIRQLRNIVERAVALSKGNKITPQELPDELASLRSKTGSNRSPKTLREIEIQAIQDVLERCGKNKSEAARVLGISRKALYKRLKDFSIS